MNHYIYAGTRNVKAIGAKGGLCKDFCGFIKKTADHLLPFKGRFGVGLWVRVTAVFRLKRTRG